MATTPNCRTLSVEVQQVRNFREPSKMSPRKVAETLFELIDLGFVQPVKDERGVTRYAITSSGRRALKADSEQIV